MCSRLLSTSFVMSFMGLSYPVRCCGIARERHMARPRARCVEERAAGASGAIYNRLGKLLYVFASCRRLARDCSRRARPSRAEFLLLDTLAKRADRDRPDRRIQTGYVTSTGENRDRLVAACHTSKASGIRPGISVPANPSNESQSAVPTSAIPIGAQMYCSCV